MINPITYCREHGIDVTAFIKAANEQNFTRFGKIQVMMASNEAYGLQLREEVEDILLDMNDAVPAPPVPKENRSRPFQYTSRLYPTDAREFAVARSYKKYSVQQAMEEAIRMWTEKALQEEREKREQNNN